MLLELSKGISLDTKFRCYGNQNQNHCIYGFHAKQKVYCLSKTKGLLFKQKWCSNSNLKQYSLIVSEGSVNYSRKIGDTLFLLWENN